MQPHIFSIFFSCTLLISCGASEDNPFTGPTKSVPADAITLTADNALDTISAVVNSLDLVLSPIDIIASNASNIESNAPTRLRNTPAPDNQKRKYAENATSYAPVDTTQLCSPSGSIRTLGDITTLDDITGTLTSEQGELDVTSVSCTINNAAVSGVISSVFSNKYDSNSNASGTRSDNSAQITVIINEQTHTLLSYSNTSVFNNDSELSEDEQAFSLSSPLIGGGILLEDTLPWRQRFSDIFAYQGITLITGANKSKILLTVIDSTQFKLEVDEDGNGSYEFSQVYEWTVLFNTN